MIGGMRHRLVIENPQSTTDNLGGRQTEFQEAGSVWGNLKEKSGKESEFRGKVTDVYTHVLTCRNTTLITAKSRLKYGNRFFNVKSIINPDGRDRYLEVLLNEGVAI